jgi:hypothetical protein
MDDLQNTEESVLCEKCSVIRFNDKELGGYELTYRSGENVLAFGGVGFDKRLQLQYMHRDRVPGLLCLKASAEAGCAFCAALRNATLGLALSEPGSITFGLKYAWGNRNEEFGLYMLLAQLYVEFDTIKPPYTNSLIFCVDCENGKSKTHDPVSLLTKTGNCMKWLQVSPSPRERALDDKNMAWMKRALENCGVRFCPVATSAILPTRLIDLRTDENKSIRLLHTSDTQLQPPTRYAALSCCWGTKEQAARQLTTTSTSLRQRLDNIMFDDMTAVMQDVAKTARALSTRYIWIDALCIIQDDSEDWTRESERIGLVYTHAFVTICNFATASCLEGFLCRSPPIKVAFRSYLQPDICGTFNLRHQPL